MVVCDQVQKAGCTEEIVGCPRDAPEMGVDGGYVVVILLQFLFFYFYKFTFI